MNSERTRSAEIFELGKRDADTLGSYKHCQGGMARNCKFIVFTRQNICQAIVFKNSMIHSCIYRYKASSSGRDIFRPSKHTLSPSRLGEPTRSGALALLL